VKSAEKAGRGLIRTGTMRARSDNEDVALRSRGKKRHILVDTLGLLLHAIVHPADRAFLQALFVRFKRPASLWLRVMTAD